MIGKAFYPALKGPRGKRLGEEVSAPGEKKNTCPIFCLLDPAAFPWIAKPLAPLSLGSTLSGGRSVGLR